MFWHCSRCLELRIKKYMILMPNLLSKQIVILGNIFDVAELYTEFCKIPS